MMNLDERDAVATQFGVAAEQVERDHLISHLLAFLSRKFGERIQFIGGTALARTHLPDGRLSEDIDLIALGDRKQVALDLDVALPRAVARSHGRLTVEPELSWTADTLPVLLRPADGRPVRLQLLSSRDRILWPTECRALVQRYADAPPAELLVPTLPRSPHRRPRHGPIDTPPVTSGTYGRSARSGLSTPSRPRCSGATAPPTRTRGHIYFAPRHRTRTGTPSWRDRPF